MEEVNRLPNIKLSLCIATFNRAGFLHDALEAIVTQMTDECEIVVSDNASTDGTEDMVEEYKNRFDNIRYFKQETNVGPDRNFDNAVLLAAGEFCWLMADDDMLKPGAVGRVLEAVRDDVSLVLVNMEIRDFTLTKIVRRRWLNLRADRTYEANDLDELFIELGDRLGSVGNMVIRRSIWLSRQRARYYGSLFIHTGVIFQERLPSRTFVISDPLIDYRSGNNDRWFSSAPEVFLEKWPTVIDSLDISKAVKSRIGVADRWTRFRTLLFLRSKGYSLAEYHRWIRPRVNSEYEAVSSMLVAVLPRRLARLLAGAISYLARILEQFLYLLERRRLAPHRSSRQL